MTEKTKELIYWNTLPIDGTYINTLVCLVNACNKYHVELDTVYHFQGGWKVTFKGYDGDAICHDGSYGSPYYGGSQFWVKYTNNWNKEAPWETYGFPWDEGDVSVHNSEELARLIAELNKTKKGD